MANIKSAQKRITVSAHKNLRNRMIKSSMKTAIRRFESALAEKDAAAAKARYISAVSVVDKAAAKGVIHKNNANRKKSRMAIRLNHVVAAN